jgi:hypothetical protein
MSITRLTQRIKESSLALQTARDANDVEATEILEDELYELELELETLVQIEYDDHHAKGWN